MYMQRYDNCFEVANNKMEIQPFSLREGIIPGPRFRDSRTFVDCRICSFSHV